MKLIIEGTQEELKNVLQAINCSEEHEKSYSLSDKKDVLTMVVDKKKATAISVSASGIKIRKLLCN
ncbi:hypothetical protein [Liquorilactobacillus mali]|uniref:hypothetical protein n=1 Tax=Liquorilactobacillus mali TaxID=1618 RepID=UPI002952F556|nr:hypothetical protein [Liquorilactobacillus mali]MDV7756858.1 hypothetical protein [Liquorilactobacillus mali]